MKRLLFLLVVGLLVVGLMGCGGKPAGEEAKEWTQQAITITNDANKEVAPDVKAQVENLTKNLGSAEMDTPEEIDKQVTKLKNSITSLESEYDKAIKLYTQIQKDLKPKGIEDYVANAKNSAKYLTMINTVNGKIETFFSDFVKMLNIQKPADAAKMKEELQKNLDELKKSIQPYLDKSDEFKKAMTEFQTQKGL